MIIRRLVSCSILPFIGAVRFLVDMYSDSVKFTDSVPLPGLVCLVSAIWWGHSVALAVWGGIVGMYGVVPVRCKRMFDDVLVCVVI